MRKKACVLGLGLILLLMTAGTVMAFGWRGGMGSGYGMGVDCGFAEGRRNWSGGMINDLALTAEQEEQILKVRQELTKDTLELRQKLQQLKLELRRLWIETPPDQAAINQKLTAMTPLRIELKNKMEHAQKRIENILTPEQLEKLKNNLQRMVERRGQLRRGRR